MIGAFIGDIAGSAYEFQNTKDYNFEIFKSGSSFTDDSIMTVAVARWLMEDPEHSQDSLRRIMEEQGRKYPNPVGGYGTMFHIWLYSKNKAPYNSWGNGSAMRVSPVGWAFDTLEETERVAELSASVTHNHPEGIKGAQATAAAIWMARHGSSREEIRSYIESRFGYDLSRSWSYLHETYGWESSCQKTVPEAIIAFLESTDFEDALRKAISMGGDSDTLCCICCSVAEAFYGGVPEWMREKAEEIFPEGAGGFLKEFMDWTSDHREMKTAHPDVPFAYEGRIASDRISSLEPQDVFVFGSNLGGSHWGGAARQAFEQFGAEWGVGVGMTGRCYAIPTMHGNTEDIRPYIDNFIAFAAAHPEKRFLVTRIGCGIAGFTDAQIAPLFKKSIYVPNIFLPESFWKVVSER